MVKLKIVPIRTAKHKLYIISHLSIKKKVALMRPPSNCSIVFHDTEDIGLFGAPIWVSTLSNHVNAPCKCISIQHGVEVTSCRWYSAPQPFTNDNLKKKSPIELSKINFTLHSKNFKLWHNYSHSIIFQKPDQYLTSDR